jgi:large subunit ribosomal protein L21
MYAVIRTGGKQYSVAPGESVEVEKLPGNVGETIQLTDVLLVSNGDAVQIGTPTVAGASVSAKITGQYKGNKVRIMRYRPKKRIRVRMGHRQFITRLQIESIQV